MMLLIATICLQADPVTLDCQTRVIRMERTQAACVAMIAPVKVWLREASAGLPVVSVRDAGKGGLLV